jgi:hypothetical protein
VTEFNTYLKGDASTDLPPAVPLVIDGRYFAESIQNFLAAQKTDEAQALSDLTEKSKEGSRAVPKAASKNVEAERKKDASEKEQTNLRQNSAMIFLPPVLRPQSSKTKRDKIEEILKHGL